MRQEVNPRRTRSRVPFIAYLAHSRYEIADVSSRHFRNEGTLLDLVGERKEINIGEDTTSTVAKEQAVDEEQGVKEIEGEMTLKRFKTEASDSGLRRSRRLERPPR